MKSKNKIGIIERIYRANATWEIDNLLRELATYRTASTSTINRAHRAAQEMKLALV